MLRSTSIKIDSWKPVKLLARQSVKDDIVALSCDLKGDVAAIISKSSLTIFTNRELLDSVPLKRGRQIHVSDNAERIFVLTADALLCYDYWGQIKWTYRGVDSNSQFCVNDDGTRIALSESNSLKVISRFGEVSWDSTLEDKIRKFVFAPNNSLVVSTISATVGSCVTWVSARKKVPFGITNVLIADTSQTSSALPMTSITWFKCHE